MFRFKHAVHQLFHDDPIDLVSFGGARANTLQVERGEFLGIHLYNGLKQATDSELRKIDVSFARP